MREFNKDISVAQNAKQRLIERRLNVTKKGLVLNSDTLDKII